MKILALDTSSAACSVALLHDQEVKVMHEVVPMRHAKSILPFIEEVIGSELSTIDALAWGCGPGSFTGLRIAASVIQALAYSHNIPVINISSLAALAQTAYELHGWKQLLVAVDARIQEVYWGAYRINNDGYAELIGKDEISSPDKLDFQAQNDEEWYGVGSAWTVYQAELKSCLNDTIKHFDGDCLPNALAVARLGRVQYIKGLSTHSFDALPRYLRDNVCKI